MPAELTNDVNSSLMLERGSINIKDKKKVNKVKTNLSGAKNLIINNNSVSKNKSLNFSSHDK